MGPLGRLCISAAIIGTAFVVPAAAQDAAKRKPSPKGARVYFESPANGATTRGTILVRAGLSGMGIAPVGEDAPNTGHHHLLIDTDLKGPNEQIPVNNRIVHFSNGETEVAITLPPGKHTLRLVFADANHMQFDPPVMSAKITVTVRPPEPKR